MSEMGVDRARGSDEQLISSIVEAVKSCAAMQAQHNHQCLSEQEQHWVRLAIIKQEQSIRLRQAIIEKSLAGQPFHRCYLSTWSH